MISVLLDDGGRPGVPADDLERAVRAACASQDVEEAEVSVALLGDAAIARLNQRHLGHAGPTDVLAFALWEGDEPVVGDIYVGFEQAARQARDVGVTLDEELVRLVVHGTLHVLGLAHPDDAAAREDSAMYRTQEKVVRAVMEGRAR
jgi:probable rRNA maturation factor